MYLSMDMSPVYFSIVAPLHEHFKISLDINQSDFVQQEDGNAEVDVGTPGPVCGGSLSPQIRPTSRTRQL